MSGESVAINDAGNLVIVGASNNSGANGAASGHARVYSWNGSAWTQRGSDLDGEAASDGFGDSAAINSDGNIVAVGPGRVNEDGKTLDMPVKAGDTVVYSKYAGTEYSEGGSEYLIVKESDILAIV
mgnify:CR=1 FL=1